MILFGIIAFNNLNNNICNKAVTSFNKLYYKKPRTHVDKELFIAYVGSAHTQKHTTKDCFFLGRAYLNCSFKKLSAAMLSILTEQKKIYANFWGSFIVVCRQQQQFKIFIDNSGQTELYYSRLSNGDFVFATDIALLTDFLPIKPTINYGYLSNLLLQEVNFESLFNEIKPIPCGCELIVTKNNSQVILGWDPQQYINRELHSEVEFADLLSSVLQAWLEPYEDIYLSFSGGLDSSALLYCLAKNKDVIKHKRIVAINYYNSDFKSTNELHYVKDISKKLELNIHTYDLKRFSFFVPPNLEYKLNKPHSNLTFWNNLEDIYMLSGLQHEFMFISGYGGDHVFMQKPSLKSVVDAFWTHGFSRALDSMQQLCSINRTNIFNVLYKNFPPLLRYALNFTQPRINIDTAEWIYLKTLQLAKNTLLHPAYVSLKALPGKKDQIDSVYSGLGTIQPPFSKQYEQIFNPFLAQPIVEWALSVPSYELYANGADRYPVRKSISSKFNTNTVWRLDKGSSAGYFLEGLKQNIDYMKNICLNGFYVKQDLVDHHLLQQNLLRLSCGDINNLWEISQLYCAEVFLSQWV